MKVKVGDGSKESPRISEGRWLQEGPERDFKEGVYLKRGRSQALFIYRSS